MSKWKYLPVKDAAAIFTMEYSGTISRQTGKDLLFLVMLREWYRGQFG